MSEFKHLLQCHLDTLLGGYQPSMPASTLPSLHELLNKNWLGEQLIDAVLDLVLKKLNRNVPNLLRVLDCSFHMDLFNSFYSKCPSCLLIKLWEEFLINPPIILTFMLNKDGIYWAPVIVFMGICTVLQGDSAGFALNDDIAAIVRWWLQDVVAEDGEWKEHHLPVL